MVVVVILWLIMALVDNHVSRRESAINLMNRRAVAKPICFLSIIFIFFILPKMALAVVDTSDLQSALC